MDYECVTAVDKTLVTALRRRILAEGATGSAVVVLLRRAVARSLPATAGTAIFNVQELDAGFAEVSYQVSDSPMPDDIQWPDSISDLFER